MDELKATKYSTVNDKKRFIKQFKLFVESDYDIHKFPKWFYTRLSMCFGHIAHYDQMGFYDTFFRDITGKIDFVSHCLSQGGTGDPGYTFADAERQIKLWLTQKNILDKLKDVYAQNCLNLERAEYERLKIKFEGK